MRKRCEGYRNQSSALPSRASCSRCFMALNPIVPIRKRKDKNLALSATFLRLRIVTGRKGANRGPESQQISCGAVPFRFADGGKESAIAKKLHRSRNFCFCETDRRNGAILAKDTCAFNANQAEQQHGTTAHRPYKHSCPHPWQRSRASSTEKCNI